jgi:hypothetical protein
MKNAGDSTQPVPNRVVHQRHWTHISVHQVTTETSNGNQRTHIASMNYVADEATLGDECNYFSQFSIYIPFLLSLALFQYDIITISGIHVMDMQ